MKQRPLKVIHAAAVRDAAGVNARPGAVLVEDDKVVAAGHPESLPKELVAQADVIDRRGCLVLPAMVNAHAHLELTDIGPRAYGAAAGFLGWIKMVRSCIPASPPVGGPAADWFVASATRGAEMAVAAGVQAIGDIAGGETVADIRRSAGLLGQTYLELFGLGPPFELPALEQIEKTSEGIQPHAPYSAGRALYAAAAAAGRPISTHLAETPEEAEFVGACSGPWRDYLQSIGRWDEAFAEQFGGERSPVQWMSEHLDAAAQDGGWLVAHCNYVSDEDIAILADTNTSVAYCPIASEYFGHNGHRYRDMLDAGVNVCLGTDSVVCADPDDPQPLGVLGAMRRLYARDCTDPITLLEMATVNGAKGLRMPVNFATLQRDADARFACIGIDPDDPRDPLEQALTHQAPVEPLWLTDHPETPE